jgi:hypothetical protein
MVWFGNVKTDMKLTSVDEVTISYAAEIYATASPPLYIAQTNSFLF